MKKLLAVASILLLAPFAAGAWRGRAPAQSGKPGAEPQNLEARVADLESQLALEKKHNDETRALLDQTLTYLEKQSQGAETLLGVLQESEQQGFAIGENWRSRQILLAGLRTYWGAASSGLPKAAAPPAAKEKAQPAPTRPVRQ